MIRLYCEETGQGEPLILLHGNSEDHTYFEKQTETLKDWFHIYALDTRGHGKSPRGTAPFSIRQFARDLKNFMDQHAIEKASLVGFSDGANIAMVFAGKYPQRVHKLILNGANISFEGIRTRERKCIQLAAIAADIQSKRDRKWLTKAEMLALMTEFRMTEHELEAISTPTLVIAGTNDCIKSQETETISSHIPNARSVSIQGSHFCAKENPEPYNQAVLAFLCEPDRKAAIS